MLLCWGVSFYNHLSVTTNSILSDLFWSYVDDYFKVDNCLTWVFKLISAAKRGVYKLFYQYANSWLGLNNPCCHLYILLSFSFFLSSFCLCKFLPCANKHIHYYADSCIRHKLGAMEYATLHNATNYHNSQHLGLNVLNHGNSAAPRLVQWQEYISKESKEGEWSKAISTIKIVFFFAEPPSGCKTKEYNRILYIYIYIYYIYIYIYIYISTFFISSCFISSTSLFWVGHF